MIALLLSTALATDFPPLDARLTGYDYPFETHTHAMTWQGHDVEMVYMDVAPTAEPSGETVLLLHGKNFSAAYWKPTIDALTAAGHRVIAPDQVGFGKSSKPVDVQYSFHAMSTHTTSLLDALGVPEVTVVGHSMGGMVATRFTVDHADRAERLVLMNPIGLEDYRRLAPYRTVTEWEAAEARKTAAGIQAYMQESYFDGAWDASYDPLVAIQAGFATGPDAEQLATVSALTYDMIYTQPVVYEWDRITVPTLLVIGERDRTALLKGAVSDAQRATMGRYDVLGTATAQAIPNAVMVSFPGVGHLPQVERTEETHQAILAFVVGQPAP